MTTTKTGKERKQKTPVTVESWFMLNAKKDAVLFSYKVDRLITAIANYYKREVKTERVCIVEGSTMEPVAKAMTKVTMLNDKP